eukprot:6911775-Pyramimonas_sp.AAC.1
MPIRVASQTLLGCLLKVFLGPPGASWGPPWRSRRPCGASWVPRGASWGLLGVSWEPLGGLLGAS